MSTSLDSQHQISQYEIEEDFFEGHGLNIFKNINANFISDFTMFSDFTVTSDFTVMSDFTLLP